MTETTTTQEAIEDVTVPVIIPYSAEYTPQEMLDEALESVEKQTTVDAVPVVIEDEEQRGPAWGRNVGLDRVDERFVALLDADDVWRESKLERQLRRMRETGAGICVEGEADLSADQFVEGILTSEIYSLTSTILVDTEQVDARFDEDLTRREDHLFMIEAAVQAGVCFVPDLYVERVTDQGMSARMDHSVDDVHEFWEKVTERVPDARRFSRPYYQEEFLYLGRRRQYDNEYLAAIPYLVTSMNHGIGPKVIAALGLSVLGSLYYYPRRTAGKFLTG